MKILFDHNVPHSLAMFLISHDTDIARDLGWAELKNGALLTIAELSGYTIMITADKNIAYQQNLSQRQISLIVLPTNDWNVLQHEGDRIRAAVERAVPGSFEQL